MKAVILALFGLVAATSCSNGSATFVFYVANRPDEARMLTAAVTAIAKKEGLETAIGQAVSDTGNVLRVVEGRGHGFELWVQSAPLSGHENSKLCGVYLEPHPDPAQFIVIHEAQVFWV